MCEHCGCRQIEPIAQLMDEHFALLGHPGGRRPTLRADLERRFAELAERIDEENLGILPAATVTLGAEGWDTVARAHERVG